MRDRIGILISCILYAVAFVLMVISLSSCKTGIEFNVHNEEIKIATEEFFKEADIRGVDIKPEDYHLKIISVTQEQLSSMTGCDTCSGWCNSVRNGDRLFVFIADWVNNPNYIKMLVWHELGHCVLGRPHNTNQTEVLTKDGSRTIMYNESIMHPNTVNRGIYEANKEYYNNELFNN